MLDTDDDDDDVYSLNLWKTCFCGQRRNFMGYDKKTDTLLISQSSYRPGYTFFRNPLKYHEETGSYADNTFKRTEHIIEMPMTLVDDKNGSTMTLNGRTIKPNNAYYLAEIPKFYKKALKESKKMLKKK